jgi:hypothetical protein
MLSSQPEPESTLHFQRKQKKPDRQKEKTVSSSLKLEETAE